MMSHIPSAEDVALALVFDDGQLDYSLSAMSLAWQPEAYQVLGEIAKQVYANLQATTPPDDRQRLNLPYASLKTQLLLALPSLLSMKDDLQLRYFPKGPGAGTAPVVFAHSRTSHELLEQFHDSFTPWVDTTLRRFVDASAVTGQFIERLQELLAKRSIVQLTSQQIGIFPWKPDVVPSQVRNDLFGITPADIALRLEGQELFEGLGPVYRVMGLDASNSAELMTAPCDGAEGRFSMVCELALETLPGVDQPILYVSARRRRWATALMKEYTSFSAASGYLIPPGDALHHAFRFGLEKKKAWTVDQRYEVLARRFGLDIPTTVEDLDVFSNTAAITIAVSYQAGVSQLRSTKLGAGVPTADQLDLFRAVASRLEPLGFKPFKDFSTVALQKRDTLPPKRYDDVLLLSYLASNAGMEITEGAPAPDDIDSLLVDISNKSLSWWTGRPVTHLDKKYENLVNVTQSVVKKLHAKKSNSRKKLFLVCQDADEANVTKKIIEMIFGDLLEIRTTPLPPDTHGPRPTLPAAGEGAKVRHDARMSAWSRLATEIAKTDRAMCLVQAHEWYADAQTNKQLRDDAVNKTAGRLALARSGGATVQYLLPPTKGKLKDFVIRTQSAVLDLVFGHGGRVLNLDKAAERCFPVAGNRPRFLYGIGVATATQHNSMRQVMTVLVATRMNLETGAVSARVAHREAAEVISAWVPYDKALGYVAQRDRLTIGDSSEARRLYQSLARNVIDEMTSADANGICFVDSTHSARLWSWLGDRKVALPPIQFDDNATRTAAWKTARIVRIRDQVPSLCLDKYIESGLPDGSLVPVPTTVARLFRLGNVPLSTYWSMAGPTTQHKRGLSCFRKRLLKGKTETHAVEHDADEGQHQSPRGVEVTLLRLKEHDDGDAIAVYTHLIRGGAIQTNESVLVRMPAPLFIIRKFTEYLTR